MITVGGIEDNPAFPVANNYNTSNSVLTYRPTRKYLFQEQMLQEEKRLC